MFTRINGRDDNNTQNCLPESRKYPKSDKRHWNKISMSICLCGCAAQPLYTLGVDCHLDPNYENPNYSKPFFGNLNDVLKQRPTLS
jgi:hypothetical protein